MRDTSPDIDRRYRKSILSKTPAERLRMAAGMFDAAKELATAGLKMNGMPNRSEIRSHLFKRFYGHDFTESEGARILSFLLISGVSQ